VSFEEKILAAASRNKTRTVLALDLEGPDASRLLEKSIETVQRVRDYICAVKINRQLILSLGVGKVGDSILKLARDLSLPTIMDAKLNDVGHTNEFMARTYFDAGFDAVIASPIAGWENGLDCVFEVAKSRKKGVLLLAYMSNPGAEAIYSLMTKDGSRERPVYEVLTDMALEWKASGLVVGATKPQIITRVRRLVGPNLPIYCPGVGTQGGDAAVAAKAGATYLIIGRSIYGSPDPASAARRFRIEPYLQTA
jgi:orotidine-5'-phosphate decarboxylase